MHSFPRSVARVHDRRRIATVTMSRELKANLCDNFAELRYTPGIQKHVTVLNTRNGTKVYIGMIKGELYLFSNNKQCGHLPTANVYIHIEYYF